jgi:hypothetical protein
MSTSGQTAAGVTVPDTKLARDATELVRESATDLVYHHSRRVFWFGSLQGRNRGLSFGEPLIPGWSRMTPNPVSSTTPENSQPGMCGSGPCLGRESSARPCLGVNGIHADGHHPYRHFGRDRLGPGHLIEPEYLGASIRSSRRWHARLQDGAGVRRPPGGGGRAYAVGPSRATSASERPPANASAMSDERNQ